VLYADGRRTKSRSNSYGQKEQMAPPYHEEDKRQLILLHHPAMMIRMIMIDDDDVTMTVEIVTVIEEIKEVAGDVVVVDKSIGTKTKVRPVLPASSLT